MKYEKKKNFVGHKCTLSGQLNALLSWHQMILCHLFNGFFQQNILNGIAVKHLHIVVLHVAIV
jgi:hypothetical protein